MKDCKPLSVLIFVRTKILTQECPTIPTKMEDMSHVPYISVDDNLMYAIV